MVAYDSIYGATPPAAKRSRAAGKISSLLGHRTADAGPDPVAPAPDYALTPDQHGKITLAGKKVPLVLALLGAGVAAVLLINPRTRGPVIAAATTAWGFLGKKIA
jgi:hypothetical protein